MLYCGMLPNAQIIRYKNDSTGFLFCSKYELSKIFRVSYMVVDVSQRLRADFLLRVTPSQTVFVLRA